MAQCVAAPRTGSIVSASAVTENPLSSSSATCLTSPLHCSPSPGSLSWPFPSSAFFDSHGLSERFRVRSRSRRAGIPLLQSSGCFECDGGGATFARRVHVRGPLPEDRCVRLRAESEQGSASSSGDRPPVLEKTKRLLEMQRELLTQIEERRKFNSALSTDMTETPSSGPPESSGAGEIVPQPVGETPRDTYSSLQPYRRPQATARPSPTSPKLSTPSSNVSARQPFPSPSTSPSVAPSVSPIIAPAPIPDEFKRSFHVDHGLKSAVVSTEESGHDMGMNDSSRKQAEKQGEVNTSDESNKQSEKPPPLAGPNVMNIILVAAECAPWSKTGGLGDVVGALPKALANRGHRVMVVAPRYSIYVEAWETGVRRHYNVSGQDMEVGYFHSYIDGVDFVFIDSPMFHAFASNIYGGSHEDVLTRMILLCKAAVEVPWHVPCGGVCYGDGNLVFIANDWHTALLPVYLQAYYRDHGIMEFTRSVLVIHNLAHQGRGPMSDYAKLGLPNHYVNKFRLFDPVGGEHNNIFMAGLITAHRIVTVSHGYAWECQTPGGGWGLDGVVRDHNWKLRGVVNGIDDKEWNPELDGCLKSDGYSNYTIETLETGKAMCKAALQRELGLPVRSDVPLLGFIGRLDHQKGVDLLGAAMPWMMDQDLQLVMLGTGRPDLENMLRHFEGAHRDKVRGWVGFSVKTAHRITAGADILLMPSRFEPCGLNQLYAMRYGTVPVVHSVGGLKDTVQPFNPFTESGLGWTFEGAEVSGLIHAVGNAMWTYRDYKSSWAGIQKRGMSQDLSWDNAAQQYEEVLLAAKYTW